MINLFVVYLIIFCLLSVIGISVNLDDHPALGETFGFIVIMLFWPVVLPISFIVFHIYPLLKKDRS